MESLGGKQTIISPFHISLLKMQNEARVVYLETSLDSLLSFSFYYRCFLKVLLLFEKKSMVHLNSMLPEDKFASCLENLLTFRRLLAYKLWEMLFVELGPCPVH